MVCSLMVSSLIVLAWQGLSCVLAVLEYSANELYVLLQALQELKPHPELSASALKVIQKLYQLVYAQLSLDRTDVWLALFVELLKEKLNWLIVDHDESAEEIHENCDTFTGIAEHLSVKGFTAEEFLLKERIVS